MKSEKFFFRKLKKEMGKLRRFFFQEGKEANMWEVSCFYFMTLKREIVKMRRFYFRKGKIKICRK